MHHQQSREASYDLMRCLACFAVIVLHAAAGYVSSYPGHATNDWHWANILDGISRFCVPLFVMLSGALYLGRRVEDWSAYVLKGARRVLVPYLFGSLLYLAWNVFVRGVYPESSFTFIRDLLAGNGFFHLYFFYLVFGLYLLVPLIGELGRRSLGAIAGTTSLLFIIVAAQTHLSQVGLSLGLLYPYGFAGYLPFFLAGYLFAHRLMMPLWLAVLGFVAASAATCLGAWLATESAGKWNDTAFYSYHSANVIVATLCLFAAARAISIANPLLVGALAGMSRLTLGIYVIHFAVLTHVVGFMSQIVVLSVPVFLIVVSLVTFIASALIVAFFKWFVSGLTARGDGHGSSEGLLTWPPASNLYLPDREDSRLMRAARDL